MLAVVGAGFPLALWIGGLTEYSFTPQSIQQRNRFWRSWTIAAGDVHRISVEFTQQWMMIITTQSDRKRIIPIVESMSIALGELYAITIIAVAMLVVILYRRGLIEW